jgi:hypothetical protein
MNARIAGSHRTHGRRLVVLVAVTMALAMGALGLPGTASAAVVGVPVTYLDHAYNATVTRPSEDKPQSKLWYLDGSWWAIMVVAGGTDVHIHELMPDHTWRDTGTLVDNHVNSTGDALWSARDGKLYVVSRDDTTNMRVNRLSYSTTSRAWTVDAGFPVSLPTGGSESASIDQDSLGRYWVTYTRGSTVWLAHSNGENQAWTTGLKPNVPDTTIKADDLSAVIAFGHSVGVMWSDQQSGKFWFAIHNDVDADSVWRVEDATATLTSVDDHINLKQLVGDPAGHIYAAVKTSANDAVGAQPTDPLVGVLSRTGPSDGTGTWAFATAGTVADDHTRPIIMIDATNQELYFLATSPGNGGDIVYKKSPLSNVSFPTGVGAPFVDATPVVNNASGSKDAVTAQTGLVILAVAEGQKRYVHAEMQLAPGAGGDTTPPTAATSPAEGATNVAVSTNVTATFSEPVADADGNSFTLKRTSDSAPVTAQFNYDPTTQIATLDPFADLDAGVQYTASLSGAIHDTSTNANALAPRSWTFTTAAPGGGGDTVAPTVASRTPASSAGSVLTTANVVVTFSEPVQGVTTSTFTLTGPATTIPIDAALTHNNANTKYTLNPTTDLATGTTYTVTLTGSSTAIRDSSNNPFVTESWQFTTASDTTPPTVTAKTPASGAAAFSRTGNITATFSEAVRDVGGTTFVLKRGTTTVTGGFLHNAASTKWTLDPGGTLAARTVYTVTIVGGPTGVKDLSGNPLAANMTWSFTTGA